jgi:hypothetical protein
MEEIRSKYERRTSPPPLLDRGDWKAFQILRTRSFRLELERTTSKKRVETNLIKDSLPDLPEIIWIRPSSRSESEISYFDESSLLDQTLTLQNFDARKYATMRQWQSFATWFPSI